VFYFLLCVPLLMISLCPFIMYLIVFLKMKTHGRKQWLAWVLMTAACQYRHQHIQFHAFILSQGEETLELGKEQEECVEAERYNVVLYYVIGY
jgi:hypothetical protein